MRAIEITFPEDVEITDDDQRDIVEVVSRITNRYEEANPHRTMWPFGIGQKMLSNPFMVGDDEPLEFDENVFAVECSERENYDWPCAKCGQPQGDHRGLILDPPAGDCEYAPAPRKTDS